MLCVLRKVWNLDQFLIKKNLIVGAIVLFDSHSVASILAALKESSSNTFLATIVRNISSAVCNSELAMNVAVANVVLRVVDALIQREKLALTETAISIATIRIFVVCATLDEGSR